MGAVEGFRLSFCLVRRVGLCAYPLLEELPCRFAGLPHRYSCKIRHFFFFCFPLKKKKKLKKRKKVRVCVCVCEEAGYTRGTEDKKNIYIYSAGGSHYGCVSYAKEADGKRKNNEFIYTHSVNNNEKGKKKTAARLNLWRTRS